MYSYVISMNHEDSKEGLNKYIFNYICLSPSFSLVTAFFSAVKLSILEWINARTL